MNVWRFWSIFIASDKERVLYITSVLRNIMNNFRLFAREDGAQFWDMRCASLLYTFNPLRIMGRINCMVFSDIQEVLIPKNTIITHFSKLMIISYNLNQDIIWKCTNKNTSGYSVSIHEMKLCRNSIKIEAVAGFGDGQTGQLPTTRNFLSPSRIQITQIKNNQLRVIWALFE